MSSRHPSLTSRHPGFIALPGSSGSNHSTLNENMDEIPLTTVRTNGSTGARRPDMMNVPSQNSEKEPLNSEEHHRHWGRRRKLNQGIGRSDTGETQHGKLQTMGKIYNKIIGFSVVTRYLVYIAPIAILLAVPMIVLAITGHQYDINLNSAKDANGNISLGPPLFKLFEWIEITWLTLWAAKLAAWFIPKAFTFLSGIVSVGTKKYATVLENLNIPLSLFLWTLAVFLTFQNFFLSANDDGIVWVQALGKVLGATFVSLAVLLGEKAIVQLIGVTYHQRSFANRIRDSKHEVQLLTLLYDASKALFPAYSPEFADEDFVISDGIELLLQKQRKKHRGKFSTGTATPMKLLGDMNRIGGKVTNAVGQVAQEITGKQVFNSHTSHSIVLSALEKLGPSEALARRIWMSFVVEGRESLFLDDFQEVLGPSYREEAEEAFYAIDADMNGDVSLDEMVRKVVEIGKERKAVSEGMKDIGQALRVFDQILMFVVFLIAIFIFLAWFKSSFVTVLATAGTALLSLSFVFAVTTQEFLGSCIFLFVKHPYDVGDRVEINKISMTVERISLLYTVFTRLDTAQTTQVPNIVLNSVWIDNISRSKAMSESFTVDVFYGTTFEDIELLRKEMEAFVRAPENTRDFQPDFAISVGSVNNLDKLTINICIKHKSNWHNDIVRGTRRSKFMCALVLALKKVPIYGPAGNLDAVGSSANPSYSVAVTDDWATKARDDSAKSKDAGRMNPLLSLTSEEVLESEKAAAETLNSRPPVVETSGLWDGSNRGDDATLNSQDMTAEERQRSRDIESVRADLMKSSSQRGRRRAGDGLSGLTPTMSQRNYSMSQARGSRLETTDEEAETGMPSSFYQMNHEGDLSMNHLRPSMSLSRPDRQTSIRSNRSFHWPSRNGQDRNAA